MANDRHGKHNKPTIAFRVTPYEQQVINERVKASGMKKQDYIVRSCICLLYTSPSPRDLAISRMPSSA